MNLYHSRYTTRTATTGTEKNIPRMYLQCLLVLLCGIDICISCGDGGGGAATNEPPSIKCPTIKGNWVADKRKTTTSVHWSTPTVSDPNDSSLTAVLKSGKGSGSKFGRGSHSVSYTVTDSGGLSAYCMMNFYVEVKECRPPHHIRNGDVNCDLYPYVYGATCSFGCEEGYKLVGASQIDCLVSEKWSSDIPKCQATECTELTLPKHGKSFRCTNGKIFKSICWLTCDEENGYAPVRGQWTMCTKDKTWTTYDMMCEDTQPPQINNCPATTIMKTADPNAPTTHVIWPDITVSDNSKETIPLRSSSAIKNGGSFSVGTHIVSFTATDSSNNKAEPCFFLVKVQSVTCDPPRFDDEYMDTPGCLNFREGASCKLECDMAIKLVGEKYITCKKETNEMSGHWVYGTYDNPSSNNSYCKVHSCPDLPAPNNGAMACDTWTRGSQCQLQCNDEYDIPDSVSLQKLYLCTLDTGIWSNSIVPNCAYREESEGYRMDEIYYFTGRCDVMKEEIRNNFLNAMKTINACLEKYCHIDNVKIKCGDEVDDDLLDFRRKRATRSGRSRSQRKTSNYISFKIVLRSQVLSKSFSENKRLYSSKLKSIAVRIAKSSFHAGGRLIKASKVRVRDVIPVCKPGHKIGFFYKDSCVPCPKGSYYNSTRDECMACTYGQYQELQGQVTCSMCPEGQTTLTLANQDKSSCKVMCVAGTYSKDGVVPCTQCPRGTYQDRHNMVECFICPPGKTTLDEGASSSSLCIAYDILFQGPVTIPVEGSVQSSICDFTISLWIKVEDPDYGGIKFQIYSPITKTGIEVSISSDIKVILSNRYELIVEDIMDDTWTHVAVVWSRQRITVYVRGKAVAESHHESAPRCPSPTTSVMSIAIRDHAYMYIRDLNFWPLDKADVIRSLSTSCDSRRNDTIFSSEQINMHALARVYKVVPSTCLKPDVCASDPCGDNICIPTRKGFKCVCRGGYTGEKCDVPPDLCKDNICRNNATCLLSGGGYQCDCAPGYRGELCEVEIADGGWSKWMEWSACSVSCGNGTRRRHRFCTNPPPDRNGKTCPGDKQQTIFCQRQTCPECNTDDLVVGKGIIKTCDIQKTSITCQVKCKHGLVFPEKPFVYTCGHGIWTPTRQTVSCTDPVTPLSAGINYTVVFGNSVIKPGLISSKLHSVGSSFNCVRSNHCSIQIGSSVCHESITNCNKVDGQHYGSLIVRRDVPQGQINVSKIQKNKKVMTYLEPLFATWNVFTHTSDEPTMIEHRALELSVVNDSLIVNPYDHPSLAFEVPGQFGNILRTWHFLDDTNWEVRHENYTDFNMKLDQQNPLQPTFMSAVQIMTCPTGAIQGGVFCIKCPPGKMFDTQQCKACEHGFYQDKPGMSFCHSCPGFKTTELKGSPDVKQCTDTNTSELKLLFGVGDSEFGILNLHSMTIGTVSVERYFGTVDLLVYNQRDQFVYFTTQIPTTIGRVKVDGVGQELLFKFPEGIVLTGLDIDIASDLLFYTTSSGILSTLHTTSGAELVLLSNLTKPRGLQVNQDFGLYWVENDRIMSLQYGSEIASAVVNDTHAVWNPTLHKQDNRIMWQSYNRLRTAYINGSTSQTLATNFTSRFGYTDKYYFYVDSNAVLMRVNSDLSARAAVYVLPLSVTRVRLVNTTDDPSLVNICSAKRNDCGQGCYPINQTKRICFCVSDSTLQKDNRTCRQDFSTRLETSDAKSWMKPSPSDFSVPPSMTLRLKVKSCHSALLALAETNRRLYRIDIGLKRGNVTEMSIKKIWPNRPPVTLAHREISILDCTTFKHVWLQWADKTLRVGSGTKVGEQQILVAKDSWPFNVNFVMFRSGINSTAEWQF
ncbi:uncharacterized protein LOC124149874 [Haliotis rufescens]|uniref:uncharacterized protein LOC124149874 n=1 Tax=Haliotis rufescens TaxID=6454 RepID=UPI00201ED9F9|nr:uncharacterized protein LOC124149874 [Haliotis rufescens]